MIESEIIKSCIHIKDIKSSYIIKIVFSFLSEKQKLNLIIYNKDLQKMFLVDIEDYKKISKKFKIDGKNGDGREYILYINNLIFKGEYLNGKRNGKGEEYNIFNCKLEFEGEYLNGKRNGKGKEYYKSKLKFEGEYLNGRKWNGIVYNRKGEMEFEIKNGKGISKEHYHNGKLKF